MKETMVQNFIPQGFVNEHALCSNLDNNDLIFSFDGNNLLLLKNGQLPQGYNINPLLDNKTIEFYCFGYFQEQRCLLVHPLDKTFFSHPAFLSRPVRYCYKTLSEEIYRIAGLGRQLQHWRLTHLYCGHCGNPMTDKEDERAKICQQCLEISYPQLYPCIIVLVSRGPQLLLARSPHFQPGIYSTLAGFIEPGESAEDAVYREVKEEVNITIKNIRYILSQPWPFPNSLMLGFLADYDSGEIAIDGFEIESAQWFEASHLPQLPSPLSISRLLIDKHLQSLF